MRIIAGDNRGQRLAVPPGIRPSSGRVREALFAMWMEALDGSLFLDLFAGSGAVGLEALSRGSSRAVFFERKSGSLAVLRDNCQRLGSDRWRIVTGELPAALDRSFGEGPFDLVFADPPYAFTDWSRLLVAISPWLARRGMLAIEHSTREELPETIEGLCFRETRTYGESSLSIFGEDRDRVTPAGTAAAPTSSRA